MARPSFEITQQVIDDAETYASRGLTKEQIADCLGICYDTLNEKTKINAEFSEAIKRGKAKGIAFVTDCLLKNVSAGNPASQMFYLKCQAGWKETTVNEHTGKDGAPVQFETNHKNAKEAMDERFTQLLGQSSKEDKSDGT